MITITPDQLERQALTAWECPPLSQVVLVSSLKRLHDKNAAPSAPELEGDNLTVWRITLPSGEQCHFGTESMAKAWGRGSGKVERVELKAPPMLEAVPVPAPAAPVAQAPVQMHHEPHNRAMWHENCPGRRFSSPMKPRGDGSWECGVCGAVGRVTAPPAAEQPEMIRCACGDAYPSTSYGAGFIDGSGMCPNCDAAIPARDITAPPAAEQPDSVKAYRKALMDLITATDLTKYGSAIAQARTLLDGGDA